MIGSPGTGYLEIQAGESFLLVGQVLDPFHLFIETSGDEYTQFLQKGDIIAVSAPEGGPLGQAVILLELVRKYHVPLLVLPKNHPGSSRLRMVVSAGPEILLACSIERGTHPEQHLLCASEKLSGILIRSHCGEFFLGNLPDSSRIIRHEPIDLP